MRDVKRFVFVLCAIPVTMFAISGCASRNSQADINDKTGQLQIVSVVPEFYPKHVAIYSGKFYVVDEKTAVQTFLSGTGGERIEWIETIQYNGNDGEKLFLYERESGGGLSFSKEATDPAIAEEEVLIYKDKMYATKRDSEQGIYTQTEEKLKDFDDQKDLHFAPQYEVKEQAERINDMMGLSCLEIYKVLPRDVETLNANLSVYLENRKAESNQGNRVGEEVETDDEAHHSFSEDDEDYLLYLRQVKDNIPFATTPWAKEESATETIQNIWMQFSAHYGLERVFINKVFDIEEQDSEVEIIPPEDAIDSLNIELSKIIHTETIELLSIELNYIVTRENEMLYAKPAWMLTTISHGIDSYGATQYVYTTYAINAVTGAVLQNEWDTR